MGNIQSKKEKYYEKVLTSLQNDIKRRQQSIQRLKTFNRSCQVHLVLFSSIFYAGYSVYLFLQYKLRITVLNKSSLAFLVLFPIGVFYLKKGISGLFAFIINRKQQVLKVKQTEIKDRIEEIKVETRYYQTKDLIEKYDKAETENKPEITRRNKLNAVQPITTMNTSTENTVSKSSLNNNFGSQRLSAPNGQLSPPQIPPQFHPPPFRSPTWMDRFMDALIGDDSRNQKYALICARCYNHNGLATPELFESVRYRCPNCGFFNQHHPKKKSDAQTVIQEIREEKNDEKISPSTDTIEEDRKKSE